MDNSFSVAENIQMEGEGTMELAVAATMVPVAASAEVETMIAWDPHVDMVKRLTFNF